MSEAEQKSEAPREFQEIESRVEALNLLREGAKTIASAMIWTKEQSQVLNSHLTVYSESTKTFWCMAPKGFDPEKFLEALQATGQREAYFSVSLQRANIFFKAKYKGHDKAGLHFDWPEKVFKVQRRRDLRFPIPDGHILRVTYPDPLAPESRLSRKVLDISAGGLAMLVDDAEAPVFHSEMKLKGITFTVRGRTIQVDAIVRHRKELQNDPRHKGWKIGLEYEGLKEGDGQHIAAYVFEESRKFFSRYI